MSFFDRQTVTVEIDAENSVVIRKLSYAEQQATMSASMTFEMNVGKKNEAATTGKLDPFKMKQEELIAAVVSWSGPGFAGREVSRANIEALPPEIIDIIQAGVDALNGGLTEEEKKT